MKVYIVASSNAPYGIIIHEVCASEKAADRSIDIQQEKGISSFILGTWNLRGDEIL